CEEGSCEEGSCEEGSCEEGSCEESFASNIFVPVEFDWRSNNKKEEENVASASAQNCEVAMTSERKNFLYQLVAERAAQSEAVTSQVRSISLGVLALVWLFLSEAQQALSSKFSVYTEELLFIAALCVCALIFDFSQSLAALGEIALTASEAEKAADGDDYGYVKGGWLRRVSTCFFLAKAVFALGAGIWIVVLLAMGLV
ncbi:hypothetical protein, partial [Stenotrophomonas sp. JAG2]|uniref:hypothetical protein n=1 Tax=Stenotrophomonas sp. JAG2 TaxID=3229243 RepID=UPI0034E2A081